MSSGSNDRDSAVDPMRSPNKMVVWRLSTRLLAAFVSGRAPRGLPQPPQNFAAGVFSKPHCPHFVSDVPQFEQNRCASVTDALQLGQRMSLGPAVEMQSFYYHQGPRNTPVRQRPREAGNSKITKIAVGPLQARRTGRGFGCTPQFCQPRDPTIPRLEKTTNPGYENICPPNDRFMGTRCA